MSAIIHVDSPTLGPPEDTDCSSEGDELVSVVSEVGFEDELDVLVIVDFEIILVSEVVSVVLVILVTEFHAVLAFMLFIKIFSGKSADGSPSILVAALSSGVTVPSVSN